MLVKLFIVVSVLNAVRFSNAASAPFITKCTAEDTACITANAVTAIPLFADGIPNLGIEVLDPSYFKLVDASKPNLKFLLKNITLSGLKDTIPREIRRDASKSKLYLKIECEVVCRGLYEMSGKVLTLNIQGEGPINVKLHFVMDLDIDLSEVDGKDGKKHFNINKFKYTYDLLGKSDVYFGNLFPDNEVLKKATQELMQNNGNEVVKEIGDPMFRASATKNIKNINNFFKAIPIEDLALD